MKTQKKQASAGFIIVRNFGEVWKILGLKLYGRYDFPKGHIEESDSGVFSAAQRECVEECSIHVSPGDLNWGAEGATFENVTLFLASTTQDPKIKKNPETGIYEHHGAEWLDFDEAENLVYNKFRAAVIWARAKIEGEF